MSKILFFGLIIILGGCKPYYNTTKVYYNSTDDLLEKSKELDISFPTNISFSGKIGSKSKQYKIVGSLKIFSETHIQLILVSKSLGFEICRLDFRNDTMVFIDKLNKTFYAGPINQFKYLRQLNFSSSEILRLFVGRNFLKSEFVIDEKKEAIFTYSWDQLEGIAAIGGIGYNYRHAIVWKDFNTVVNYSNYMRKYNVPSNCYGNFGFMGNLYEFNFDYNTIKKGNDTYKVFEKPKNYSLIKN